jgi:siderophore synthetase component
MTLHVNNHLTPEVWAAVNRHLVRKAIAEFSHEQVLQPQPCGAVGEDGQQPYRLDVPEGRIRYRFQARLLPLRHWCVEAASIVKTVEGQEAPLDALQFVIELKQVLGLKPELLPIYLEEISSTLYGAAYKRKHARWSSAELADAEFQTVEASMTEGHPGFVANNGRIGFDAKDYVAYAPEAGGRFQVVWLAVRKSHAEFNCLSTLTHELLLTEELGEARLAAFRARLRELGEDPQHYWLMPAHPWQWHNKLAIGFAADIAARHIVYLGPSDDLYQAQQSIRTFFNVSRPQRRYVKTSLSILNMGFMRGLSPYYMSGTPAINEWIHARLDPDPVLRRHGFSMLREVASIGYRNRYLESAIEGDSPHKKMFSALWRESPMQQLQSGERLMSMTALLHIDARGDSLLACLIRRSGLAPHAWLRRYLRVYLVPLLHCFYAHDLVFMPHGENLILVLRDHVPVRALLKDIAEECALLEPNETLPDKVRRIAIAMPDEHKLLGLFIDVFDGFFRHLQQVLAEAGCCSAREFWSLVADSVREYQASQPALADKFRRHDLFQPKFAHSCLNRLQLWNTTHMLNLGDPSSGLKFAEPLDNPLAAVRTAPPQALNPPAAQPGSAPALAAASR